MGAEKGEDGKLKKWENNFFWIFYISPAALIERADSLDVELNNFRSTIEELTDQIDQVAAEIDRRVEYHASCDA